MSNQISIHDNSVLSYTVQCRDQRITIHTEFYGKEPQELTDIIFSGVAAHHFERATFSSILFDVNEVPPEEVYAAYQDVFERNKSYGWLQFQYETETELMAKLCDQGIKGFLISSSYGMNGFVLAQEMRLVPSS